MTISGLIAGPWQIMEESTRWGGRVVTVSAGFFISKGGGLFLPEVF